MNKPCTPVSETDDDLELVIALVRRQNGPEAVSRCLRAAAALVEHAAYEMAQSDNSQSVAQLILTASNLERIAQSGEPRAPLRLARER